ncbi:hypothetical protein RFI_02829 [Reticulomyxa filosa]|uniref:Anaphase-promoting complex subunit 4 WD40 domain-containing protein n=1 Tax=Reticulomyxa filosa TaxID=46433 RepID=X6P6U4_RETFI|nr:hypothetical protein RFI_02829 [Reticulomyxa filosa]|eukprot:ETO34265.1 hypothetical protein RFI_02829 [Reticulomyxa filosa]
MISSEEKSLQHRQKNPRQRPLFQETNQVLGKGGTYISWNCSGKLLATVSGNHRVRIYNRYGNMVHEFALSNKGHIFFYILFIAIVCQVFPKQKHANKLKKKKKKFCKRSLEMSKKKKKRALEVLNMGWDFEGEFLGVLQAVNWNVFSSQTNNMYIRIYKPTIMAWAKCLPLACFSCIALYFCYIVIAKKKKKNIYIYICALLIYNRNTFRKLNVMGKHSKKILFGQWSKMNQLVLLGKDNNVRIIKLKQKKAGYICNRLLLYFIITIIIINFSKKKPTEKQIIATFFNDS